MILANCVGNWAEENNVLHERQFCFRPGRTTTVAVFSLQTLFERSNKTKSSFIVVS